MSKSDTKFQKARSRRTKIGTDETFFQLMTLSGSAVLKLLGVPAAQADKYRFRATVLKDKKIQPDIEGIPLLKSDSGRVIIEFQGYEDKFIRYRLFTEALWNCVQEGYSGKVKAAIIFTEAKYQQAALPLQLFEPTSACQLGDCCTEIVLTDYTEAQLLAIDPKLVVLAPFTVSKDTDNITLLEHGHRWQTQITQVFASSQQPKILNLLGLLVLNRFAKLTYEEVRTMLNLDLSKSVAVRQMQEMARAEGRAEGRAEERLEVTRQLLVETLQERFSRVPKTVGIRLHRIQQPEVLKTLFRQALQCQSLKQFQEVLAQEE